MLQLVGVFRSVGFLKYRVVFGSRKPYLASELQDPSLTLFYNFLLSSLSTLLFYSTTTIKDYSWKGLRIQLTNYYFKN